MGQCSFSRQPEAEQGGSPAAAASGGAFLSCRQEKSDKPAARRQSSRKPAYRASSRQDELVLMVSLDAITKLG
ncbi:hypothetical protein ACP4OV_030431 [Aristida adscensionis]